MTKKQAVKQAQDFVDSLESSNVKYSVKNGIYGIEIIYLSKSYEWGKEKKVSRFFTWND